MTQTNIKMIVCDLDGTLVDSMNGFGVIAQDVMGHYYGTEPVEALVSYQRTSGLPFRFQLEKLFPMDARNEEASRVFEATKKLSYDECPFFNDVIDVLPGLVQRGYRLCVSSNNDEQNVVAKMRFLAPLFAQVLGYRPGFLKGRDHFEFLQKKYGFAERELLFIGDSLHDARSAHVSGVPFIARLGTFAREQFSALDVPVSSAIDDFHGLVEFLEGDVRATRRIGRR